MPHKKYSSHIEKLLLPDEEIIDTYEQSDAYVYENPFHYGVNIILIVSFVLEVLATLFTSTSLFEYKFDLRINAVSGAIWGFFFIFNMAIFMLTYMPIGNWLRGLRFGDFDYDYLHASEEEKDSYKDGKIYMRSFYTSYIYACIVACSFALHLYQGWPDAESRLYFLVTLFAVGLSFIPLMIITMILRRINRKLIILTNQRVIVFNKRTKKGDSMILGKWVLMDELSTYYTITLHDKKILSKYYLAEGLAEYFAMRMRHQHMFFAIRGVKKFEELHDKLADRTTPATEERNQ